MRTKVQVAFTTETAIFSAMQEVSASQTASMLGRINSASKSRIAAETEKRDGDEPKDATCVRKLSDRNVARLFVVCGMSPEAYIDGEQLSDAEWSRKMNRDSEARTRNLKAYKKTSELANFLSNGSHLEAVFKTFFACALINSEYFVTVPRDVAIKTLNSHRIFNVSDDLAAALEEFRAKHMSDGAPTQTSQCILTLANLGALTVVRNGRFKDMSLNLDHVLTDSLANLFGMSEHLERARAYRARQSDAQ